MMSIVRIAKHAVGGVLAMALLAGCAVAPTQEMSDARQSVQAAQDAGASGYAVENLENARRYLEQAERELELRYFNRARHDAIVAKSEAVKARNVALAIRAAESALEALGTDPDRDALRTEVRALIGQARDAAARGQDRKAIRLATEARRKAGSPASSSP